MFLLYRNFKHSLNKKGSIKNKKNQIKCLTINQLKPLPKKDRVFVNSIPKSGTHLLKNLLLLLNNIEDSGFFINHLENNDRYSVLKSHEKILRKLPGNTYIASHMPYTKSNEDLLDKFKYKSLLLVRDPRDILISQANFYEKRTVNRWHEHLASLDTIENRLDALFFGVPLDELKGNPALPIPSLKNWLYPYLKWNSNKNTLIVKFEDLVGINGGGSHVDQLKTIEEITNFLGIPTTKRELEKISLSIYSEKSNTFNKGMINKWKIDLPDRLKENFNVEFDLFLNQFDYEKF